jgi:hypothetical protein
LVAFAGEDEIDSGEMIAFALFALGEVMALEPATARICQQFSNTPCRPKIFRRNLRRKSSQTAILPE